MVTAGGKFFMGQDAKGKDVFYSASCSATLVPSARAQSAAYAANGAEFSVFLYFAPKAGKFDGFVAEVPLVWDGAQFFFAD